MQDIPTSSIKIPLHSAAAIQCKLKEYIETGDHYLYIYAMLKKYMLMIKKRLYFLGMVTVK